MRQLIVTYTNTFTETEIVSVQIPYNPNKAMYGYYTRLLKGFKAILIPHREHVRCSVVVRKFKSERMIVSLPNGVKLDAPAELSTTDIKIISLNLEAIKLRLTA